MQFQKWKGLAMLANPDREWQTRRVAKEGEYPGLIVDGQILWVHGPSGRVKWMIGRTYAIQTGRGIKAIGRFELLAIRQEPLQDITPDDVEAEGVDVQSVLPSPAHPAAQKGGDALIRFMAHHEFAKLWNSINKRKGKRWAANPDVWVHTMRVVKEG